MEADKAKIVAAFNVCHIIADAIHEAGRIPSGHLYAAVCGPITLADYEAIISMLKRIGMVDEKMHELIWVGPK